MNSAGDTRVWRYTVAYDVRAEFERENGPTGGWATLFARAPGFVDTTLYAEVSRPGSYLTVDRFRDEAAWRDFRSEYAGDYVSLGTRLQHLTTFQEEIV